jgi:undecaprenyl-diphosphatase
MTLFHLVLLAIVQGITEFLPISSSAHLVLLHELGGAPDQAIALDIAVHLGSILAVVLYFRPDVLRALSGLGALLRGDIKDEPARLAIGLIIATIPAVIVGAILALSGWVGHLRNPTVIGVTMIVFGLLLYWVHRVSPEQRHTPDWRLKDAVIMGLWQALALVPGVSRSGITMTAARHLGFKRHSAAKLSMLMSIPITLATGAFLALELRDMDFDSAFAADIALATVLAFGAAYAALALMMRFLDRVSFTPYVVYRVVLGVILLVLALL